MFCRQWCLILQAPDILGLVIPHHEEEIIVSFLGPERYFHSTSEEWCNALRPNTWFWSYQNRWEWRLGYEGGGLKLGRGLYQWQWLCWYHIPLSSLNLSFQVHLDFHQQEGCIGTSRPIRGVETCAKEIPGTWNSPAECSMHYIIGGGMRQDWAARLQTTISCSVALMYHLRVFVCVVRSTTPFYGNINITLFRQDVIVLEKGTGPD